MQEIFHFFNSVKRDFNLPHEVSLQCENWLSSLSDYQSYHAEILTIGKLFNTLIPYIDSIDWSWEYGQQLGANDFGLLGPTIATADNLQESLDLLIQYSKDISPLTLTQKAVGDSLFIQIKMPVFFLADLHLHLNIILAGLSQLLTVQFDISPDKFRFELPCSFEPTPLSHHSDGLNIRFHGDKMCLILPMPLLAKKNLKSDQKTKQQLLNLWHEMNRQSSHKGGFSHKVMPLISTEKGRVASIEEVAAKLNTSPRNLRLLLEKERTTFKELVYQYRMKEACFLLKNTDCDIERISEKVGYSSVSNFRRAFKNGFDLTPTQYRQNHHIRSDIALGTLS